MNKTMRGIGRSFGLVTNHKYKTANNFKGLTYEQLKKITPAEVKVKNVNKFRPALREMFHPNSNEYSAIKWLLGMKQHMSRNRSLKSHSSTINGITRKNKNRNNQATKLVEKLRPIVLNKDLKSVNRNFKSAKQFGNLSQRLKKLNE